MKTKTCLSCYKEQDSQNSKCFSCGNYTIETERINVKISFDQYEIIARNGMSTENVLRYTYDTNKYLPQHDVLVDACLNTKILFFTVEQVNESAILMFNGRIKKLSTHIMDNHVAAKLELRPLGISS